MTDAQLASLEPDPMELDYSDLLNVAWSDDSVEEQLNHVCLYLVGQDRIARRASYCAAGTSLHAVND
jgi:hypothetical protein